MGLAYLSSFEVTVGRRDPLREGSQLLPCLLRGDCASQTHVRRRAELEVNEEAQNSFAQVVANFLAAFQAHRGNKKRNSHFLAISARGNRLL